MESQEDVVRLLHEIDGHLGLAIHRGEGADDRWKKEAAEYVNRLRRVIPLVEGVGRMTDAERDEVRRDERMRMAKLLRDHAEAIGAFTGDDSNTLKLVVYMLRLG